jgi:NAD(P)-dependent dehydrogenase (short-subunit alcohol dehydrogenase family)
LSPAHDPASRTVLVTGATRGLGRRTAELLAGAGHRVLVAGRSLDDAQAVVEGIAEQSPGADAIAVELDVADPASIARLARELDRLGIAVDVLVDNAAVCLSEGPLAIDEGALALEMATNVYGPWLLMRAFVPGMVERGYGRVVNVSSGSGSFAEGLDLGTYSVSKAALDAVTVTVAREVPADVDVLVNAVCPGWVRTDMGGPGATVPVDDAAAGVVWAATLPAGGPTGSFFRDGQPIPW